MSSKLSLYDALIENVTSAAPVLETVGGECWAMAEAEEGMGLGMMTPCDSIPALYPGGLQGLSREGSGELEPHGGELRSCCLQRLLQHPRTHEGSGLRPARGRVPHRGP